MYIETLCRSSVVTLIDFPLSYILTLSITLILDGAIGDYRKAFTRISSGITIHEEDIG